MRLTLFSSWIQNLSQQNYDPTIFKIILIIFFVEKFQTNQSVTTPVCPPIFVYPACILKNDIFEIFFYFLKDFEFFIASDKSKLWYLYP